MVVVFGGTYLETARETFCDGDKLLCDGDIFFDTGDKIIFVANRGDNFFCHRRRRRQKKIVATSGNSEKRYFYQKFSQNISGNIFLVCCSHFSRFADD